MEIRDTTDINFPGYIEMFEHLFSVGQILCGQRHGLADRLRQEIADATQGRALLLLRRPESTEREQVSSPLPFVSFPVQFREHVYGTLDVVPASSQGSVTPTNPALPIPVAHLLAQICGWLLYMFELSAFLQMHFQQSDSEAYKSLTKRERDVLALICRGYNQETISEALSITSETVKKHRQHIYKRLGVHSEHTLLLVAYRIGLFSPLEELY